MTHEPGSPTYNKGLMMILSASILLSLQNVITRTLLSEQTVLGIGKIGGVITPGFGNSLLLLVLRSLMVLPVIAFIVAPKMYPNTFKDIKDLFLIAENSGRRNVTMACGTFLFISQFCIYVAIGSIPAGIATTIFFIYPTVTMLLAWWLYGDKPSSTLIFAMITIYIGGFITIPEKALAGNSNHNYLLGGSAAAISGIAFAGYVILIKKAKMHSAPFTIVNFLIILLLGCFVMPFVEFKVNPEMWTSVLIGTFILAIVNLTSYLLNNVGIPIIGPSLASVIGASGPAVTAFIAFILISENLVFIQVIGICLVSLWVLGISMENMKKK